MESDEKFQGEFCKHVFIRKKPEGGEELRYVCQGCNSIYVNCVPSYFVVVEDDVER